MNPHFAQNVGLSQKNLKNHIFRLTVLMLCRILMIRNIISLKQKGIESKMLNKYKNNPILSPNSEYRYESVGVLNPGAFFYDGKVQLLYRAAGEAPDYKICVCLATSSDGFNFERQKDSNPVLFPTEGTYDGGCIEDARATEIEGIYYVTYACRPYPPGPYWLPGGLRGAPKDAPAKFAKNLTISALARTMDFIKYEKIGPMVGGDIDDRDVILFPDKFNGKYIILRRPFEWKGAGFPSDKPSIWLSYSKNLLNWNEHKFLASPKFTWEIKKIGGGAPPIKTEIGWFCIYHGVDAQGIYRAGLMMLDLKNPEKIIARYPDPILEPETDFEKNGIFPNVVFPTGNVIIGDRLFVYYGGADKVCCVATANFESLVDELMKHSI